MIRRFRISDLDSVNRWLTHRGLSKLDRLDLPEIGFLEPDVACGFLYLTDANFGIVDTFITNKEVEREIRIQALRDISFEILSVAESLGLKFLKCDSKHKSMQDMALLFDFELIGNFKNYIRRF